MSNCCDCILITQSDFFGVVDIPENIDQLKLNIAIRETKVNVKKYICSELWNELCQQIEDNELTELNEGLLCKIKAVWIRYAYAELLENNGITLTQDSVVRKFADESDPAPSEAIYKHANKWRMFGNNYVSELKKYLKDNKDANDLYMSCYCLCNDGNKLAEDNNFQFGGIA